MANLLSLIKLRKHAVDEKQKILAELYRQIESLDQTKQTLLERLQQERDVLSDHTMIEMFAYFGRFSQNIHRMIERIDAEKAKLEVRVQVAQDDVRETFSSMKKIEIVQRQREEEEKRIQDAKENSELDEIAIEGFRRKEDDA